jgi:hypothetical protein
MPVRLKWGLRAKTMLHVNLRLMMISLDPSPMFTKLRGLGLHLLIHVSPRPSACMLDVVTALASGWPMGQHGSWLQLWSVRVTDA